MPGSTGARTFDVGRFKTSSQIRAQRTRLTLDREEDGGLSMPMPVKEEVSCGVTSSLDFSEHLHPEPHYYEANQSPTRDVDVV